MKMAYEITRDNFNSRPRGRAVWVWQVGILSLSHFNSRPRGRAVIVGGGDCVSLLISILALAGGRSMLAKMGTGSNGFQFSPSREGGPDTTGSK